MQNKNALLAQGATTGVTAALTARRLQAEVKNINARTSLTQAQTNAIEPAASLGEGAGEALDVLKNVLGPQTIDYNNIWDEFRTRATNAKERVSQAAQSVNLNPFKARQQLIQIVNKMDTPPLKDDAAKYRWAINNQDKIKRYLERTKQ